MMNAERRSQNAADFKNQKIYRCAIYIRVSTDEQARADNLSMPAQEEMCLAEIHQRQSDGWVHSITISDPGRSGFMWERPGLSRLIRMARNREIDVVVVYKRERLFRNADLAAQAQSIFDSNGVRVLSHVEGMHDNTPNSVWMRQLTDANAQFERSNGRLRVNDCMRFAAKRGDWKGGRPSFGYSYPIGTKTLLVNESEAQIVKFIFERIAAGVPMHEFVGELRRLKFYQRPTGRRLGPSEPNSETGIERPSFFYSSAIRAMIANPVYRGVVRVKNHHWDSAPSDATEVSYDEFKGRHVPIIADELWFRANQLLKTPETKFHRGTRSHLANGSAGPLQGLLQCACCNAGMTPGFSRKTGTVKKHRSYRCVYCHKGGKESGCTTKSVSAVAIEAAVVSLFQSLESNPSSFARANFDSNSRKRDETIALYKAELLRIDGSIVKEKACVDNLVEFVRNSGTNAVTAEALVSAENAKSSIAVLEGERIQLELRLNKLLAKTPPLSELGKSFGCVCRALTLADFSQKAAIFRVVIRRIRLNRITIAKQDGSKFCKRTFRMIITINTDGLMNYEHTERQKLLNNFGYREIELKVTFEITNNHKEQRVLLLEHAYSVVSATYTGVSQPNQIPIRPSVENPVQRALRWKLTLADGTKTARDLAAMEKVSPGLISQNLALLKLPQQIVDFLKEGRDQKLRRPLSSRELQRLVTLPDKDAVEWFYARIGGEPIQGVMPLDFSQK